MFSPEQRELWDKYAEAREEAAESGEIVTGFQHICLIEGVEPPSEEAVRKELGSHR